MARWAIFPSAARQKKRGKIGAAVKIESDKGAGRDFGHRKPARSDKSKVSGSNPLPATRKKDRFRQRNLSFFIDINLCRDFRYVMNDSICADALDMLPYGNEI